jgi:hypothetical protein
MEAEVTTTTTPTTATTTEVSEKKSDSKKSEGKKSDSKKSSGVAVNWDDDGDQDMEEGAEEEVNNFEYYRLLLNNIDLY